MIRRHTPSIAFLHQRVACHGMALAQLIPQHAMQGPLLLALVPMPSRHQRSFMPLAMASPPLILMGRTVTTKASQTSLPIITRLQATPLIGIQNAATTDDQGLNTDAGVDNRDLVYDDQKHNMFEQQQVACQLKAGKKRSTRVKSIPSSSHSTVDNMDQEQLLTARETVDYLNTAVSLTPLMQEIHDLQRQNPDHVLLVQVGSFFEIYDAGGYLEEVASLLGLRIAQFKRRNDDIRFAGFPMFSYRSYVSTLLQHGKTVAMVHQVGKDTSTSTKGFRRAVTRIITPGTALEDDSELDVSENSFLLSISFSSSSDISLKSKIGLAWMDISTGEFFTAQSDFRSLETDLARIQPREIVVGESMRDSPLITSLLQKTAFVNFKADQTFTDPDHIKRFGSLLIQNHPYLATRDTPDQNLFKDYGQQQIEAAAGLLAYISHSFPLTDRFFCNPVSLTDAKIMKLDSVTMQSLEILRNNRDRTAKGSLFHAINYTKTSAGARLLASRVSSPSTDIFEINRRFDIVEAISIQSNHWTHDILVLLEKCSDIKRSLQRLNLTACNLANFRDIVDTLESTIAMKEALVAMDPAQKGNEILIALGKSFGDFSKLYEELNGLLNDGFLGQVSLGSIADGISEELDCLRIDRLELENQRMTIISDLRKRYGEGVSLIVDTRYGAGIDFTKVPSGKKASLIALIDSDPYASMMKHQRSVSNIRIHYDNWTNLYSQIQDCEDRSLKLEMSIFEDACIKIKKHTFALVKLSEVLCEIDVSCAFAILSIEHGYTRPTMVHEPVHQVKGSRHPVVEHFQQLRGTMFVKNDIQLADKERLWIVTGPNMGGKSTFLRQCALISIIAQAGSFVPADSATLGIVDGIYTRIGASDNLSLNESTFMVEMRETANILNNATSQSLVIMDEVGRGTSMLDGLSLAYGIVKHLVSVNKSRGLFATHYHELATFTETSGMEGVGRYMTTCKLDDNGGIACLFQIQPGVMVKSHGIQMASHAGLPTDVIQTANDMYMTLLQENQ
ncbi:hypothetical protein BASA60_010812 [Batrachochytrium salamandrivorans]|nr:hypothetical protein BASA60_010812 [Batrachochytrium salamandrivorans]KAH9269462.1 hypothetical protein BASA83_008545 [Batrachochytrium salamandrivorans]